MSAAIAGLRLTIRAIDDDGNVQKFGGRYDLDMNEEGVEKLSNREIADMFAGVAHSTVIYELRNREEGN